MQLFIEARRQGRDGGLERQPQELVPALDNDLPLPDIDFGDDEGERFRGTGFVALSSRFCYRKPRDFKSPALPFLNQDANALKGHAGDLAP